MAVDVQTSARQAIKGGPWRVVHEKFLPNGKVQTRHLLATGEWSKPYEDATVPPGAGSWESNELASKALATRIAKGDTPA